MMVIPVTILFLPNQNREMSILLLPKQKCLLFLIPNLVITSPNGGNTTTIDLFRGATLRFPIILGRQASVVKQNEDITRTHQSSYRFLRCLFISSTAGPQLRSTFVLKLGHSEYV